MKPDQLFVGVVLIVLGVTLIILMTRWATQPLIPILP